MSHLRLSSFCVLLLALSLAACGPTGDAPPSGPVMAAANDDPPPPTAAHRRMLAELDRVAARVDEDHLFLSDAELKTVEARLAVLGEKGPARDRFVLLIDRGDHLLRLGRVDEGLESMRAAERLLTGMDPPLRKFLEPVALYRQGVAAMRLGETKNCIASHDAESCILPLGAGGIHRDQEGSRLAISCFERMLVVPDLERELDLTGRWLLNVAYMTVGEWPDGVPAAYRVGPEAFASDEEFPRFRGVADEVGLNTRSLSGGVVVEDLDGDGLLDVVQSSYDPAVTMKVFRNTGDGRFVERTRAAGLEGMRGGLNMIHADYDGDGDGDILVLRGAWMGQGGRHPNSLLANDGRGNFTDVTEESGLLAESFPTQTAAFADYDNDGDLDLYIGNEAATGMAFRSQLFRNTGDGRFEEVTAQAGVANYAYAKGVAWGDYDGDRLPDLYVSNYRDLNRLYRNLGDGRFEDVAPRLGITEPILSFPTWFWDYDNDGVLDLYVALYLERVDASVSSYLGHRVSGRKGTLYRGDGRGGFTDVAPELGLTRLVTTMGAGFGDLDNDGWLDFYLGTGFPAYEALIPNVMYHSRSGLRFADVTTAGGFGHVQKGHAVVFADFDDDGDQDVFEQMGGAYRGDLAFDKLYENPGFGRHYVTITLEGVRSNRSAIGARIEVEVRDGERLRSIFRTIGPRGSFGSGPLRAEIGLGAADRIERLEIWWPATDTRQVFRDVEVDRFLYIREGDETFTVLPRRAFRLGG